MQALRRRNRRWVTNLAAFAVGISASIIAGLAGLADGTLSGCLKIGGIAGVLYFVVHIAVGVSLAI